MDPDKKIAMAGPIGEAFNLADAPEDLVKSVVRKIAPGDEVTGMTEDYEVVTKEEEMEVVLAIAISHLLRGQGAQDTSTEEFNAEVSSRNVDSNNANEVIELDTTNICASSEIKRLDTTKELVAVEKSMAEIDVMPVLVEVAAILSLVEMAALFYLMNDTESQVVDDMANFVHSSRLMLSWCAHGVPMVLVCFGVFKCANYWCALWCGHGDDWRYKNPSLVKKIKKDLLDPGELMRTAGSVQLVQVKVPKASLVMEADVQWSIHEVDGKYEVHSLTSKITKDMLDPGDVEALEIDDGGCSSTLVGSFGSSTLLVLSWCALGVPLDGLHLAMIWCALVLDVMYEDPSPAQRIHKDLLDPGGFVTTAGLVQEVQVMLAKVYLVMESSKEDVIFHIGSTATWCDLLGALVKFAYLGPRSVWTSQGVLK